MYRAHSPRIQSQIKKEYGLKDLETLRSVLKGVLEVEVAGNGIAKAANRRLSTSFDPTNYDAVWLRDSVWISLGYSFDGAAPEKASSILRAMASYLGSPSQLARMRRLIAKPDLIHGNDGAMEVPHIRFNGESPVFEDVLVEGKPQRWNHKQNDALGIFLLAMAQAQHSELWSSADLNGLLLLPLYFERVRFYQMEDAGAWEEIERLNTSSVGLVTSGLESLKQALGKGALADALKRCADQSKHSELKEAWSFLSGPGLDALINKGYETVLRQIDRGESPDYPKDSPKYRRADAALLNLIYPCKLLRLSDTQKLQVLKSVEPLIGEIGIRRYLGDAYQCEGYWDQPSSSDGVDERTMDYSSADDFVKRGEKFKKGSEAQWFFDSWLSHCYGEIYRKTRREDDLKQQVHYFNRSLAQITGEPPVQGADRNEIPSFELPESYNVVRWGEGYAPSPITPLNWAKACLRIALRSLEMSLHS